MSDSSSQSSLVPIHCHCGHKQVKKQQRPRHHRNRLSFVLSLSAVRRLVDSVCLGKSKAAVTRLHGLVTRAYRHYDVPLRIIFEALKLGECLFGDKCPFAFCKFHHRAALRSASSRGHHRSASKRSIGDFSTDHSSVCSAVSSAGRALTSVCRSLIRVGCLQRPVSSLRSISNEMTIFQNVYIPFFDPSVWRALVSAFLILCVFCLLLRWSA